MKGGKMCPCIEHLTANMQTLYHILRLVQQVILYVARLKLPLRPTITAVHERLLRMLHTGTYIYNRFKSDALYSDKTFCEALLACRQPIVIQIYTADRSVTGAASGTANEQYLILQNTADRSF